MTTPMYGLATVLALICGTAVFLGLRVRYERPWSSPSGAFGGVTVERGKTLSAKLACFAVALATGYFAGFCAGWWT